MRVRGEVGPVGGGVLGGEAAPDVQGFLIGALRVAEALRLVVDNPQIGEGYGEGGPVGGGVLGGEAAPDVQGFLIGALRVAEALRLAVDNPQIGED